MIIKIFYLKILLSLHFKVNIRYRAFFLIGRQHLWVHTHGCLLFSSIRSKGFLKLSSQVVFIKFPQKLHKLF
jgi:hypothetical protein